MNADQGDERAGRPEAAAAGGPDPSAPLGRPSGPSDTDTDRPTAAGSGGQVAGGEPDDGMVSSARKIRGVLRSRDFRRLWLSMSFSSFGDWLGLLAITALAASRAHGYAAANFALGGVLVVRLLPSVLLGPLAGAFADKFDRRRLMVVTDFVRCLLYVSIPLIASLWWLFVAQFLIECFSLFWIPAKEASVPNLIRRDQLETANQLSLVTTYGITPVLAAVVFSGLAVFSRVLGESVSFFRTNRVDLALYTDALTFLVSGLVVLRIRRISRGGVARAAGAEEPGLWRLLREGWRFVGGTPLVRGLVIGILGAFAAGGAVIGAGKTYAVSLGGGDAAYGVLFGAVFVGLGLGMAAGPRFARDLSRRRLFGFSLVFAGGCLVLTSFMPYLVLSVIVVLGVGFGAGMAYLAGTTLLGAEVADEVRGRTFAFVQSLVRVDLIATLAAVPFLVGLVRQQHVRLGGIHFTVDGTRILLAAAGLLAIAGGRVAYRQMDDRPGVPIVADLISAVRGDTTARRRLLHGGLLVAFEGGEGSGKSTQAARLAEWLTEHGVPVTVTHEPGATEMGAKLRALLLDSGEGLTPRAEALLFAADRAHHVAIVVRPALDRGEVVLTDRYVDSSLAYQGAGRALPMKEVRRLSRWATGGLEPDLTILLDIDPEVGLRRVAARRGRTDRLERESLEFHQRVRRAFRALADEAPRRYLIVDAARHPEGVASVIRSAFAKRLSAHRAGDRNPLRRQYRSGRSPLPARVGLPGRSGSGRRLSRAARSAADNGESGTAGGPAGGRSRGGWRAWLGGPRRGELPVPVQPRSADVLDPPNGVAPAQDAAGPGGGRLEPVPVRASEHGAAEPPGGSAAGGTR